jgi:glycosyltransferase involved in cell wall biosynthesis
MGQWCTVVIPTYNGRKYLPELISSLLDAVDEHCTVLFIDDASVDGTIDIISAVSHRETRILRNDRNLGLFATLNLALQKVETEYVSLIFQDSVIEREYFGTMRRLIEQYPEVGFLWTGVTDIDEFGRVIQHGLDTGREELVRPGRQPWVAALHDGCFWIIGASTSKTERLRHHGFRTDLPQCGDHEFLLRAIREEVFLYLERPLIKLRVHIGNASFRYARRSLDLRETILVLHEQMSRFEADFDPALLRSLRKKLVYYITRRAVHQAVRGSLLQATKTLALLRETALSLSQEHAR